MDTLSSYVVGEESNCMRSKEEEEDEEDEEEEEEEGDGYKKDKEAEDDESGVQKQQTTGFGPGLGFFCRVGKEVYHYVGKEIVIEEGLDSYAGMIWPGALALCKYLETHHEERNLVDKAVLEIGAGTGLVSVVAALLGAWVTATDLPDVLSKLRVNLSRNTRGHCRHTPQVAALSWGHELERAYPASVYHYDYVLAADVVYHHDFLDELLTTMKHFCRQGTTIIWANKIRFETDLNFTENFKKAFHTSLLAEDGDMKIFMATCRTGEEEVDLGMGVLDPMKEKEGKREEAVEKESEEEKLNYHELDRVNIKKCKDEGNNNYAAMEPQIKRLNRGVDRDENHERSDEENKNKLNEEDQPENNPSNCSTCSTEVTRQEHFTRAGAFAPRIISSLCKDVYRYAGQDIIIHESIDSFGAVMWPAALALCSFLDNNRQMVNIQGKEVLELGAGTGLVTIVASLLGASATATDLPEVLSNLKANVMRNTRGRCRHMPKVAALSWGYDLGSSYPGSVHHYNYVLAADVVYHHDFLDELLATMKQFCKPGTTLIWANKVRLESDLNFTVNFKKAFHANLVAEDGDMKIFMAKCKE